MGRKNRPCKRPDNRQIRSKWGLINVKREYEWFNFPKNGLFNIALIGVSVYMAGAYMYTATNCIMIIAQ